MRACVCVLEPVFHGSLVKGESGVDQIPGLTVLHPSHRRKLNIVDNMIAKLEKYANNLEEIVEARTGELIEEKKKTDRLLYRMMPA